ncbi:hypothetical protein DEU56DRAFT_906846 [Suillus clintonianus]|uniref:uncharacterized protein n=1 Tax=Suillus clintonianus TaxID=1904413 RepID=UPI001B87FA9A|nr:uncharacterized protein DEU56DRAFT_906846 [Suillus clintonianus]KAG2155670.1 hypothetical protein DEU56DRAFT_906846 [Suillus clintonianus]
MSTERSDVSGNPYSFQPGQWAPPRAPLPPHRLAKIANALGVSMPSPAGPNFSSPCLSSSFASASPTTSNADLPWRVATSSPASAYHVGSFASSSQSKFLLHVIPPLHLLHDFDASDPLEPAPPPTASGYHAQFRRGTLVSLQPSLHAQLNAIAKEYALPSTIGLILYLITTSPQSRQNSPMPFVTPTSGNDDAEEPGPRISEEIWKHIWARVLKAEREESLALSRGPASSPFGLGLGLDSSGQSNLRPLITPMRTETPQPQPLTYPITPSSTTSSVSDLRSHSKSAPLSSSSLTHSEPDTPDTSRSSDHEIPGIDLPGLNSSSIIPILAKVEFDIDRRKAAWYEPWLRGRRMTHAKRAESRQSNRARSRSRAEGEGDGKRMPFDLKLVERMQNASSVLSFTTSQSSREGGSTSGYAPLSDVTDEAVEEDTTTHVTDVCHHDPPVDVFDTGGYASLSHATDEVVEEDTSTHVPDIYHHDPLVDVFGTDADTWADMRAESQGNQPDADPNIVDLALDASSMTVMPEQESGDEVDDAEEIRDIMRRMSSRMSKPMLTLSIPSSPNSQQMSSPPISSVLAPKEASNDLVLHVGPSPMLSSSSGGDSTSLPYANSIGTPIMGEIGDDDGLSLDMEQEYMRSRSPTEEKRGGAVFEDLNLGLDLGDEDEEYDENDPNDQRRSQYLMRAKLDEIERTLAQFSPRHIKTDDLDEDITITHARTKSLLTLHAGVTSKLSTDHSRDIPATGNSIDRADASEKSWPAVSYSSIANKSSQSPSFQSHRPTNLPPSPPRLAVNGVSTGAPKSFAPPSRSASPNSLSTETKIRKRDLEPSMYPPPLPRSFGRQSETASDSPIPLSPDPFGRYPSYLESDSHSTPTYWDPATGKFTNTPVESRPSLSSVDEGSVASTTPSSRFSADSASFSDAAANTAKTSTPLVSVKTFKKLWRRSKSTSVSAQQPPTPSAGRASFQGSAPPAPSSHDQPGPPPPPQRGLPTVPPMTMPRTPSPRPTTPTNPSAEKTSVRKSILKTWKSVSGSTASSSAPSEPRRDTERPVSNETIKPRRPSVLDAGIPPTPKLAEQYLPSNHARTGSGIFERRKSVGRSRMGPSSNLSTSSQDAALPSRTHSHTPSQQTSPLPPGSISPARSLQSTASRHSHVDGSFETAQYELVSTSPRVYPSLSYPYQTLDQD